MTSNLCIVHVRMAWVCVFISMCMCMCSLAEPDPHPGVGLARETSACVPCITMMLIHILAYS